MNATLVAAAATLGLAAALLVWVGVQIGAAGLARYREHFTDHAHFSLRELFVFIDPGQLFVLNLAAVGFVGVATWLVSGQPLLGLAAAVGVGFIPRLVFGRLRRRRIAHIEQQLPDALLVLAGGLKAGVSLSLAIQQLVREGRPPISQEFDLLMREQRLGVPLDQALDNLAGRIPLQAITLVVAAMRIANDTGGSLAEALERAALTVRSQLAMEGKIRALTAQGKLQALIVGLLPLALMLVLGRMEPEAMALLWSTRMGWATLAAIALLECFGVLLIRKIVTIDV